LLLALTSNGFVLQSLSFALPELVRDWGVRGADLSLAFTLHLLGISLGAFSFGYLGDRQGRRTMLLASAALQALATLACPLAQSPLQIGLLRLVAGIGVGGMTPNVVALAMELSPRRGRTPLTAIVLSGVAFGSSLPALVAPALIPAYGWTSLFWLAGSCTVLLLAALALWMPESRLYLARRSAHARFTDLFTGRLALTTTCLWMMYAGTMLAMHLITSWLPLLLEREGLGARRAAGLTGLVHLAGAAGMLCSTALLGHLGRAWLIGLLAVAFTSVSMIALEGFASDQLGLLIAGLGFGMVGCQGTLGAIAGKVYPSSCRTTGVGAAIAVGRLGSLLGPLAGGAFQAAGYSAQGLFTLPLWALGAAIAAAIVFTLRTGHQTGGS
jgi:AAHS family 4-hydroxybenzoate transporter-like MFS transporter